MPLNIIIFGAPGCGKGTASDFLVETYGFAHFSTGDLLREEVKKETPVGRKIASLMAEGSLISDELVIDIIFNRLQDPNIKASGVLLDGFPRTLKQAEELSRRNFKVDSLIFLSVPPDVLLDRCLSRRQDPITGKIYNLKSDPPPPEIVDRLQIRSDDTKEKHCHRMKIFDKQKQALLKYYSDVLVEIDANVPVTYVFQSIRVHLDKVRMAKGEAKSKL